MPQILEATMLICFGFSWPMSVYKNIKAKTAKSMSLPFILLIVTGYIAGIAAKLWTNTINYVLVVYVLNLLIVSSNVVVYFINRRHDKVAEQAAASAQKSETAMPAGNGSVTDSGASSASGFGTPVSDTKNNSKSVFSLALHRSKPVGNARQ